MQENLFIQDEHQVRMNQLRKVFSRAKKQFTSEDKIDNSLLDEAIGILVETIRYAKTDTPEKMPDGILDYLDAIADSPKEGTLLHFISPRAKEWVNWAKEYKDENTSPNRKEHLQVLLQRVGLIRNPQKVS